MANIKDKLKLKKGMKEKIKQEASGNKNDPRILNYYDLKDGEKMHILFVPDVNGEIWTKFKIHGPNLNEKGVGGVRCSDEANQTDCPACQQGYELLNEGKEDDNDYEEYKEEAKRWFARENFIAQCLVLESPFEVNESPDGNQVKLIRLPYAVKSIIEESVIEGLIDEDEICTTPFVLKNKKTGNGKNNGYKTSYFARQEVTDEELEYFEDLMVEPYDFSDLDLIPKASTEKEVQKWLDGAIKKVYGGSGDEDEDDDDSADDEKNVKRQAKSKSKTPAESEPDEDPDAEEESSDEKEDKDKPKKSSSIRDRLKNMDR